MRTLTDKPVNIKPLQGFKEFGAGGSSRRCGPLTDGNHVGIAPVFESGSQDFREAIEESWEQHGSKSQGAEHYPSCRASPAAAALQFKRCAKTTLTMLTAVLAISLSYERRLSGHTHTSLLDGGDWLEETRLEPKTTDDPK